MPPQTPLRDEVGPGGSSKTSVIIGSRDGKNQVIEERRIAEKILRSNILGSRGETIRVDEAARA